MEEMRSCNLLAGLLAVVQFSQLAFSQTAAGPNLSDDSDWWSITRALPEDHPKSEQKDTDAPNFTILGVTLGQDDLPAIQVKLGKTTVIERGDAANGRSQICYSSEDGKFHLNFETGEVNYVFYLFQEGPKWTGSDLCAHSKSLTNEVHTASGLRLGLTSQQVQTILGKPTRPSTNGDLIYVHEIKKRTSESELKRLRKDHPELSENEFQESYGFYYLTAYIVAKFSDSGLTYLAVSKSETD